MTIILYCFLLFNDNTTTSYMCIDVFMNDTLTDVYIDYMKQENVDILPRVEEEKILTGSTDFGNVTAVVPATHPQYVNTRKKEWNNGFDITELLKNTDYS